MFLLQDEKQPLEQRKLRPSISAIIFIACGTWLIALGLYFIFLRPSLLPEDLRYMGTSAEEIQSALPGLERWTHRVFTVMGGFMAGAGANDLRGDEPIRHAREMDLDRPRVGRAIHSRDDEPDELSAQLRFQMAAPDTVSPVGDRIGVPQNEAVGLPPV